MKSRETPVRFAMNKMCNSKRIELDSELITLLQVSDLISKIQKAYVETLEELSWMDAPSKEKAREKVKDSRPSWGNKYTSSLYVDCP